MSGEYPGARVRSNLEGENDAGSIWRHAASGLIVLKQRWLRLACKGSKQVQRQHNKRWKWCCFLSLDASTHKPHQLKLYAFSMRGDVCGPAPLAHTVISEYLVSHPSLRASLTNHFSAANRSQRRSLLKLWVSRSDAHKQEQEQD